MIGLLRQSAMKINPGLIDRDAIFCLLVSTVHYLWEHIIVRYTSYVISNGDTDINLARSESSMSCECMYVMDNMHVAYHIACTHGHAFCFPLGCKIKELKLCQ